MSITDIPWLYIFWQFLLQSCISECADCLFISKRGCRRHYGELFYKREVKKLINLQVKQSVRWSCIFKTIYKWGKAGAAASSTLKLSDGEQIIYKCQQALPGKHAVYTQWTPGGETPHLPLILSLMRRLFGNEKIVYHLHSHNQIGAVWNIHPLLGTSRVQ